MFVSRFWVPDNQNSENSLVRKQKDLCILIQVCIFVYTSAQLVVVHVSSCFFYLFAQCPCDKPYEAKMRNIGKTATFKRIKTISFTSIIHSSAEMPILPFSPLSLIRRPTNLGVAEVGGAFDWISHMSWDHGAAEGARRVLIHSMNLIYYDASFCGRVFCSRLSTQWCLTCFCCSCLFFFSLHHNESVWNHQPIRILSCCCRWCRRCCCPPGSKFLLRSSRSQLFSGKPKSRPCMFRWPLAVWQWLEIIGPCWP